ncbi:hypothetical protein [Ornithinimicrobium sp. Y1694]|uniref:mannitol dehydrogenase family protein n=1 Tax=Ornithinimicrobium sp. Y1694 TaxID=3418590 RepID=UPI003CE70901
MKAVIIGAGRVGLGCAAQIAHCGGLEVVVLGRGQVVQGLKRHERVQIETVHGPRSERHDVPVQALDLTIERDLAVEEIADADLVLTAVGPAQLPSIANLLGAGLERAGGSVDVVALENTEDAGDHLRHRVGAAGTGHGFSGAVVDRVVARRDLGNDSAPVSVVVEPACRVTIDGPALTRDWSWLPGVRSTTSFAADYRAKLYCFSAGHATAAYLGQLKGYRYLHAAVTDPEIAAVVLGAMEEGRRGLLHRYGLDVAGSPEALVAILHRFSNAALGDTTLRVGRDVPRKLARDDRLVGAARLAYRAGAEPTQLGLAVAAALQAHLGPHQLPPAGSPARLRQISTLTGLRPAHPLIEIVDRLWADLGEPAALLSLRTGLPAWESLRRAA